MFSPKGIVDERQSGCSGDEVRLNGKDTCPEGTSQQNLLGND